MSDRIRPEDDPALRDKINREAAERGEPPHVIIHDMAVREGEEEWRANMDAFIDGTNRLIRLWPDSDWMQRRNDYYPVLRDLLNLNDRHRAAGIEKAYLREELKALGPRTENYAMAAAQLSDKHLHEDQKLAASHDKDRRLLRNKQNPLLYFVGKLKDGHRDRIGDLHVQELDNLKGRQDVETLKLAKALSQERAQDLRQRRDRQQAREPTERSSQTDTAERRAWERIREARQRREDEKSRGRDRDAARER